ncbi:MAG: Sedoheptulose 7-phosphate isomerase [Candidatus Magasanikbacteria bacterium GW2011_GWA2_56_11]|uniref:Sedoheptulose 7-phosphate isomerase n=1 Tax=Candidatus Magasanikbacteria bacterium GW2011_GWA2_56_11 TaxID=1619044 RepID=A0A0G2AM21_9BACT|nr:MAG: Sedoheptulose 7-phosphate isomerase [Candidatus Magasanikbacteria bacterium GW2011_GWA2_56_11]
MKDEVRSSFAAQFLDQVGDVTVAIKVLYSEKLDQAVDLLFAAWKQGHWVYIMGNGGSASTATHLAADLNKTICPSPEDKGLKSIALVDNIPLVSALTNDWGWENIYVNQLETLYVDGGVGIAFSVHGGSGQDLSGKWSQNVLKGLQYVKDRGGRTIGFSGFDGGPMKDLVDVGIVVPARSTPIVEGLHVVLHHLVVFGLKERIAAHKEQSAVAFSSPYGPTSRVY